jgi:BirA family biotin operon repressor/biotin-[acetyl-CoA-carboxylase] ligase
MELNLSRAFANKLIYFDQLESTNSFLMQKASDDIAHFPDMTVVSTAWQTAGRGRNNRQWISSKGSSLASSILIRKPVGDAHWYGILLALAAVKSLRGQQVDAGLKWPNDVLVQERKLAGILGQSRMDYLVIGIGLNLSSVEIENSISLSELSVTADYDLQLASILENFAALRKEFETLGVAAVLGDLRSLSHTLGKRIRVNTGQGHFEGVATDIDNQGRLVLDNGSKTVSAGDILHLRGVIK